MHACVKIKDYLLYTCITERRAVVDTAIAESKKLFDQQDSQGEEDEDLDTNQERVTSNYYKKSSERARKHGKARLMYEDMVRRAEKLLCRINPEKAIALSIEQLPEAGQSVSPVSLLTAEETNKTMLASGCRDLLPTPNCNSPTINPRYRTVDGTCNNREYPLRGAAGTAFRRILRPQYEDGISSI